MSAKVPRVTHMLGCDTCHAAHPEGAQRAQHRKGLRVERHKGAGQQQQQERRHVVQPHALRSRRQRVARLHAVLLPLAPSVR